MTTKNIAAECAHFMELLTQRNQVSDYNNYCRRERDRYWKLHGEKVKTIRELLNPSFFKRIAGAIFGIPLPLWEVTGLKRDKEELYRKASYWEERSTSVSYLLFHIDQQIEKFNDSDFTAFVRVAYTQNENKD